MKTYMSTIPLNDVSIMIGVIGFLFVALSSLVGLWVFLITREKKKEFGKKDFHTITWENFSQMCHNPGFLFPLQDRRKTLLFLSELLIQKSGWVFNPIANAEEMIHWFRNYYIYTKAFYRCFQNSIPANEMNEEFVRRYKELEMFSENLFKKGLKKIQAEEITSLVEHESIFLPPQESSEFKAFVHKLAA